MENVLAGYYRPRLPHIWCPGCGNGVVTACVAKAIEKLQLDQDQTAVVSGIGCSSRASGYLNFDTLHTAHGRAIPFATGIKLVKPDHNVIVLTGDGDSTAIGGNHLIHAARRNIDVTVVVFNNTIYGMTGGQFSPLTPQGSMASTAPFGCVDRPFDIFELARGAGATFIARATTYHAALLADLIAKGIQHKGFSLIEAITACPISFGRQNKMGSAANMMKWQRDHAVMVEAMGKMKPEQLEGKFPIGLLHQAEAPEYAAQYQKVIQKAMGSGE